MKPLHILCYETFTRALRQYYILEKRLQLFRSFLLPGNPYYGSVLALFSRSTERTKQLQTIVEKRCELESKG
jgi:hypothetical protein